MDVDATLQAAVAAHQSGDLNTAERLYRSALDRDPNHADANNLLGVAKQQTGHLAEALRYFDHAISASPGLAMFHFNKGNALRDLERLEEASDCYRRSLEIDPTFHPASLNLGAILVRTDNPKEAQHFFQQIVDEEPMNAAALLNLGKCHHINGDIELAYRTLKRALNADIKSAETHLALGRVLIDANNLDAAKPALEHAVELDPRSSLAHLTLSIVLGAVGAYKDAQTHSEKALALDPNNTTIATHHAWNCHQAGDSQSGIALFDALCGSPDASEKVYVAYAEVMREMQRPWDALDILHKAPAADSSAVVLTNVGAAFQDLNLPALAIPFFENARQLENRQSKPRESLAFQLLQLGHLERGWEELNARIETNEMHHSHVDEPPVWQGEQLEGKTLFVRFEQGAGEHIIQASMVPDVAAQTGRCIVECAQRLVPIVRRSIPDVDFVSGMDKEAVNRALKDADLQSPGLHLGRICRNKFGDFPGETPTLQAEPDLVRNFRKKYEALANGRRIVGISWISGSSNFGRKKTIPLENLGTLFDPNDVFIVSLQYGSVGSVVNAFERETGTAIEIDDSFDQMKDLESFFAQVASMDLVVTISNTTAHVAGATGTPAWVLLPGGSGAIWYWFIDLDDSPWYPSVRIFRSEQSENAETPWWQTCLPNVKTALKKWLSEDKPKRALV